MSDMAKHGRNLRVCEIKGRREEMNKELEKYNTLLNEVQNELQKLKQTGLNRIEIRECPKCKHKTLFEQSIVTKLALKGNELTYGGYTINTIHQCLVCGQKYQEQSKTTLEEYNEA